jgi:hypothetical protein
MKLLTSVFAMVTLLSAADPQARKAPAAPAAVEPLQIPAGAVETEPGTFHFADAQGKKWIYRKTPFGIARLEDFPSDKAEADPGADVKAIEDGGTIRFERPGPFGIYKWQKSKSELNAMEQAVWNRQKGDPNADQPSANQADANHSSAKQASVKQD